LDHLRGWIGRTEIARDLVTCRLVAALRATLDQPPGAPEDGEEAPLCLHWCLAPPIAPASALGPDGHPARGGFLPPVPLPRRMWAGGRLDFSQPLLVGEEVERTSTIRDVTIKEGRSGRLCFVTVEHVIAGARGTLITERQDIVYRDAEVPGRPASAAVDAAPAEPMPKPLLRQEAVPDPVMLFRYSALTFNGHRIHYDRRYVTEEEGYPGLVVHGPLQATWLVHLAAMARRKAPRSFSFRGVKPLFDGKAVTMNAAETGNGLTLWVADAAGAPTMRAEASW